MLTDQQESSFLEMLIFLEADRRRILNYMLDTSPSPFTHYITSAMLFGIFCGYQNNSEFLEKGMVVTLLSSIAKTR